ncbi:MAG: DUF721 domain-containing protein [Methylomonas sp.]|nr:DUF721 domain-containing protein [Methylomonas sp.]PPD19879.1 MAG: hypothetical protein CTY23_10540 [Methylomonas sp.]PPD25448.1 MAG: hypothetical protein CTY22_08670 [Methylomonas sp.]PPD36093.1 MAG: hypothetical protein CTY21_08675 [Methylomonas sp.]PPD39395.1 MAG: hypothetical protein CTY17_08115 [Methylomonas sp.]
MNHTKKTGFKAANQFEQRSLAICLENLAEQQRLSNRVRAVLPNNIAPHVVHCVPSANRLLIYAESASWASQIRFFQGEILAKIQASGQQNISTVQVRVLPPLASPRTPRKPRLPSIDNVRLLQHHAAASEDVLASALARLATTLSRRQQRSEPVSD